MSRLQIHSSYPLTGKNSNKYQGIASDGFYFYCTAPKHMEIHCYDLRFEEYKKYSVGRPYFSVCYDVCEKCFWALSLDADDRIYQLDRDMQEVNCIRCSFPGHDLKQLKGISCQPSEDELLVTTSEFLLKVCKKNGNVISFVKKAEKCECFLCAEMLNSDYMVAVEMKEHQEILFVSGDGDILMRCPVNSKYTLIGFTSFCQIYILAVDSCGDFCVLRCTVDAGRHSCADLIESIALIETSLAHILNAEGEKLQKVIRCSDDFCEIMKANDSVSNMIKDVAELEKVLVEKLRIAKHLGKC